MNEYLMEKRVFCPLCQTSFNTTKVKTTKLRMIGRDTDFCTYYEDINPYFYEINVCPKCGFAFSDSHTGDILDEKREKFKEIVSSKWTGRDFSGVRSIEQAIETFKLAITSGEITGEKNSKLAGLCLRLSWLYRIKKEKEEELRFMRWSAKLYEEAYQWEDFSDENAMELGTVLYLLGELNYRLEEYEKASKWFNVAFANSSEISASMMDVIRDRWQDIKEDIREGCRE
ncbi:MAG TPA: DUF2225 domain-containing protein [Clostridiales bacterium]|nr:DUF2225 domain-containing protein [Clostridiales bacterium]